jgi:hypothetical protein
MNTQATVEEVLGTMFSIRSVQGDYKEEFSLESSVEFRSFKRVDSREFSSAKKIEKMALYV